MIKFAIVGCGRIGNRHAKHIHNHKDADLVAVYDVKKEKAGALSERYGGKHCHSLKELLEMENIDMVNICTPNGDHHISSIEALKAKKNVLVEKPMAIKKVYCEAMIDAALKEGKQLFVVKQNRFNPPVQAVAKLINEGKLGKVYMVVVNCYWNRNENYYLESDWKGTMAMDGGTLFTQFSHFVDILYYLFGDIEVLSAHGYNANHGNLIEFEDTGFFAFNIKEGGGMGTFNYTTSCYEKNMEGSITIFAENATIKIGGKYLNTIDFQNTDGFDIMDLPTSNKSNNYGDYQGSMSNHDYIIDNVVKTLKGEEKIMTNAYEGLKVVEIIDRVYECMSI